MKTDNIGPICALKREHGNIESSLNYVLKQQIPKNARILDIGCRYGSLIYNLHRHGYSQVYGLDINLKAINAGKTEYPEISPRLICGSRQCLPFDDASFDIVLMFDVIEHIDAIERYLRNEVCRVLKTGGRLLFQTPNKYTNIPWEIAARKSFTRWKKYHCSLQTRGSLKKMLQGAGFTEVTVEKHVLVTEYNMTKTVKSLGRPGIFLLKIWDKLPLSVYPHFWGRAGK
jgi:ubiquinone/menaquinone biosynthesis C-methylase UbiE